VDIVIFCVINVVVLRSFVLLLLVMMSRLYIFIDLKS